MLVRLDILSDADNVDLITGGIGTWPMVIAIWAGLVGAICGLARGLVIAPGYPTPRTNIKRFLAGGSFTPPEYAPKDKSELEAAIPAHRRDVPR